LTKKGQERSKLSAPTEKIYQKKMSSTLPKDDKNQLDEQIHPTAIWDGGWGEEGGREGGTPIVRA